MNVIVSHILLNLIRALLKPQTYARTAKSEENNFLGEFMQIFPRI